MYYIRLKKINLNPNIPYTNTLALINIPIHTNISEQLYYVYYFVATIKKNIDLKTYP